MKKSFSVCRDQMYLIRYRYVVKTNWAITQKEMDAVRNLVGVVSAYIHENPYEMYVYIALQFDRFTKDVLVAALMEIFDMNEEVPDIPQVNCGPVQLKCPLDLFVERVAQDIWDVSFSCPVDKDFVQWVRNLTGVADFSFITNYKYRLQISATYRSKTLNDISFWMSENYKNFKKSKGIV